MNTVAIFRFLEKTTIKLHHGSNLFSLCLSVMKIVDPKRGLDMKVGDRNYRSKRHKSNLLYVYHVFYYKHNVMDGQNKKKPV